MDLTTLTQPPWLYVMIGIAVALVALVIWAVTAAARRKREREALQDRYGAEYDRTLAMHRNKRAAVADLKERERLHSELELRTLNEIDRDLVRRHMATLQYRFVEDPSDVMLQTDRVITEVLRAKGYPVADDRERSLRLFSVDYPQQAVAVRTVMEGNYDGDVAAMRQAFLDARGALAEVSGISYVLGDAADRPEDLRVEQSHPQPDHV